jgi:SAM-dependent methyltransferase
LELPDESVDRVICFDAFHHLPNQAQVLAEFGRVLRPGGIAGFSEPGRAHSATPQSQYEMRNHRVLENDIVLEDIAALARNAGFTDVRIKVVTDDMDISLDEYLGLVHAQQDTSSRRDELRDDIYNRTHNGTITRSIFFLHKGPLRRDSRSHLGLRHRISAERGDVRAMARVPFTLRFHLENTGTATWLATNNEIFGVVRLGSHLYDSEERLLDVDFSRHGLARSVEPGATEDLEIELTINSPGRYRMGFDLVAEGVTWFENVGSKPLSVTVDVA